MQAGGDVLGGCLTAKHVTLEHLGQLIASYVGKVPVGVGAPQCLPVTFSPEPHSRPPTPSASVCPRVAVLRALLSGQRVDRQACRGRGGWVSTVRKDGRGGLGELGRFAASGPGVGRGTVRVN